MGRDIMTLKQIEYFQKVCQTGNISTAADALFVSRSVVSRTILELEEEFETVLFTRSRNGVTLTESGHILARLFEVFMASCTAAKERIRSLSAQEQSQPLRIGVTPTNAYCVYKNYLERFQEAVNKGETETCIAVAASLSRSIVRLTQSNCCWTVRLTLPLPLRSRTKHFLSILNSIKIPLCWVPPKIIPGSEARRALAIS